MCNGKITGEIDQPEEINKDLLKDAQSIGICGATSTPKWLMEACKNVIMKE
jgi:4-hydroxy-3-methylbut-2-enyl diphosphate reductase